MEVITLIKANIRHKRGSFFSVIILMFIISAALTTIISVNQNISKRSGDALDAVGVGDFIITISDLKCTDEMITKVENNKDVDHVEVIPSIFSKITVNGTEADNRTYLQEYDPNKHPYQVYSDDEKSFIDKPELLEAGEIYVPISFKNIFHCKLGDEFFFTNGSKKETFKIVGFIEEPLHGAETIGVKLCFLSKEDFNRIYQTRISSLSELESNNKRISGWNYINVYQNEDSNLKINELTKSINADSGIISNSNFSLSKKESTSYTLLFIQIISGILYTFTILLFIVILVVMGHSISTGFEMDYVNIGVLKSQGFTKSTLRKVYVYQYIFAQLLGIIMGVLISIPAIRLLNIIFVPLTGLLASTTISIVTCGIFILLILFISYLYVLMKTKKISEITPMRAISGGRESIFFSSRFNVPVNGKHFNLKLAIRQLTSNKKQYISSGLIVSILVFFMITVTTLNSSMDKETIEKMFGGIESDISVNYSKLENKQKQIEEEIEKVSSITKKYQTIGKYLLLNNEQYLGLIYSDPSLFYSIIKGRAPLYDNEIVITEIVAEEVNKSVGDTVNITSGDNTEEYLISGIFQSTMDVGRCFGFSMDAAKKIDNNIKFATTEYQIKDSIKSAEIVKFLTQKYGDSLKVVDVNNEDSFTDTIMFSIKLMEYIIYGVSIVFVLVVVFIVCSKMFLKEQKDIGIYKAFGFTTANLRLQFALRFLMVSLLGSAFGILCNVLLNNKMMSTLLRNLGIVNFVTKYSILELVIPSSLITICFFVFSYIISGKIKRVDTKSLIVE